MPITKKKAKVLNENVCSYVRPSKNAFVFKYYNSGEKIDVYPIIEGWYELRPVDTDGIMNTEFIAESDIEIVK